MHKLIKKSRGKYSLSDSPLVFFGLRALSTGGANLGGEGIAAFVGCLPGAIVENCDSLQKKLNSTAT